MGLPVMPMLLTLLRDLVEMVCLALFDSCWSRVFFWCLGMVFWKIEVICFYMWIHFVNCKTTFLPLGSGIQMSLLFCGF